ncbi:response regulator transcription factor [Roseovarius sp. 2305UL8-3]|uniref:response regulator transcription factor n=1 Tax=Roseovarius conchicola TaxID=3121636 RepID=UPI003526E4AF
MTESELEKFGVKCFETVDQLVDTLPNWRERLRLIVLDQPAAGKLDSNLAGWVRTQSGASFACAYCDVNKTRPMVSTLYPAAVSSFFPLNLNFDAWISMLKLCLSGHLYVTPELIAPIDTGADRPREQPVEPVAKSADQPSLGNNLDRLTQREMEVLQHVAKGRQNKVIAAKLGLSENTVKLHIHHVISKLGVHNRTEAAMIYATSRD